MSAFCIYSISRSECLTRAKSKVPNSVIGDRSKPIRPMTQREWSTAVGMVASVMYRTGKPAAVSPKFDAPQFAEQWAQLASRQGIIENWQLFAYQPTGAKCPKTRLDVMAWSRYVPGALAA